MTFLWQPRLNPRPHNLQRLLRTVATAWLSLIGAVIVVDQVAWSHVIENAQANTLDTRRTSLDHRLTAWEQQTESTRRQLSSVIQSDINDAVQHAVQERLSALEQAAIAPAAATDPVPWQRRLDQLDARLNAVRQAPAPALTPARRPVSTKTVKSAAIPPFQLLGIEWRGGERFLSIAPANLRSLTEVRLLRPGDKTAGQPFCTAQAARRARHKDVPSECEGGWRLEFIEGRTAVFRIDGRTRRLAVP